ncbi:precorrin-2 dehydrogenase/sirohydrochlorin ferrochelatase family protein [Oceanobacillus oncorhynchi]|uniref:precorrin-2 dehydrogenase/sirohydrochlorin ferrochelatase family protein n=1 Tax=Oceanobacillus oncorhynchi TaxID=545501 RepID=UPI002F96BD00
MEKMYPVMMNLDRKRVAIIGGGETALRKAKELAGTGAKITVISPGIREELFKMHDVVWKQKKFEAQDLKNAHLIFAATDNQAVNAYVCQSAADNQWVHDTSQNELSNFIALAGLSQEKLTVALSTSDAGLVLTKELKEKLEKQDRSKPENAIEWDAKRRNKK